MRWFSLIFWIVFFSWWYMPIYYLSFILSCAVRGVKIGWEHGQDKHFF